MLRFIIPISRGHGRGVWKTTAGAWESGHLMGTAMDHKTPSSGAHGGPPSLFQWSDMGMAIIAPINGHLANG